MANIVVTGGLGFVGANLIPELAKHHSITTIDHGTPAYGSDLVQMREALVSSHAEIVRQDICDLDGSVFQRSSAAHFPDLIVHLAAWPGVRESIAKQDEYFHNNVIASQRILTLARTYNIPTIMTSSSSVYGDRGQYGPCREEDATGDGLRSAYSRSKWITESWCQTVASTLPPVLFIRPFTLYGPLGRPDMAYFSFAKNILQGRPIRVFGDLKSQRDFTFIRDAIYYLTGLIEAMLDNAHAITSYFRLENGTAVANICNGQPERLSTLLDVLESELSATAKVNFLPASELDLRGTFGDPSKLHSLITPQRTDFREGLRAFCEWLRVSASD